MGDLLGKVFTFIFASFLMFIGTAAFFTMKIDTSTENFVKQKTEEFVNTSRQTGTITDTQYRKFLEELDSTGNSYDVSMTHFTKKYSIMTVDNDTGAPVSPELNGSVSGYSPNSMSERSIVYYSEVSQKEILDTLYKTGNIKIYSQDGSEEPMKFYDDTGKEIENIYSVDLSKENVYSEPDGSSSHNVTDMVKSITSYAPGGTYKMDIGDFLEVTVKNRNPTLGREFLGIFLGRPAANGGQIYVYSGGYIGNKKDTVI